MGAAATFVSYRLGGTDGVSIESAKWMRALATLGFTCRRVAGEIHGPAEPGDLTVPWLALLPDGARQVPGPRDAATLFEAADLVVVENVCSLPLNLPAAARDRDRGRRDLGAGRAAPPRSAVATSRDTGRHRSAAARRRRAARHDQRDRAPGARRARHRRGRDHQLVRRRRATGRPRRDAPDVGLRRRRDRAAPTGARDPAQERPRRTGLRRGARRAGRTTTGPVLADRAGGGRVRTRARRPAA